MMIKVIIFIVNKYGMGNMQYGVILFGSGVLLYIDLVFYFISDELKVLVIKFFILKGGFVLDEVFKCVGKMFILLNVCNDVY